MEHAQVTGQEKWECAVVLHDRGALSNFREYPEMQDYKIIEIKIKFTLCTIQKIIKHYNTNNNFGIK